jgi:hypothetical protein
MMRQRRAVLASGIVAVAACSSTTYPTYSAPSFFVVSDDAVKDVVTQALAAGEYAARLDGAPTALCEGRINCQIAYTVKPTLGDGYSDVGLNILDPTRQIWKALFNDPVFQQGTIAVQGPHTTAGGKTEMHTLATLTCDRGAASQIDWDKVEDKGLKQLCTETDSFS